MTSNPVAVTHVLCPVDFSAISQHALDHASAIAYRNGATVTMLHVFATLPTMDLPPLVLSDEDRERLIRDIQAAVCPVLIVRSDAGRAAAAWSEHRIETGVPG